MTHIYIDGACAGNPGPGGWGLLWIEQWENPSSRVQEWGGHDPQTTNNRMEMTAAREGLAHLQRLATEKARPAADRQRVTIFCDSQYVVKGATEWLAGWKRNGWINSTGTPVANREIWEEIDHLASAVAANFAIHWVHILGHQGNHGNERVDEIAVAYSRRQKPELFSGLWLDYPAAWD